MNYEGMIRRRPLGFGVMWGVLGNRVIPAYAKATTD